MKRLMTFGPVIEKIVATSFLAWVWISITVIHMVLNVSEIEKGALWNFFDSVVMSSSFLVFTTAGLMKTSDPQYTFATAPFVPILVQFLFWWGTGYLCLKLFLFLRSRS